MKLPTKGHVDGRMDGWTDKQRDPLAGSNVRTHLKTKGIDQSVDCAFIESSFITLVHLPYVRVNQRPNCVSDRQMDGQILL